MTDYQPLDLSQEISISTDDALAILNAISAGSGSTSSGATSAKELLLKSSDKIITLCKSLDDLLGGGITIGQIVSILSSLCYLSHLIHSLSLYTEICCVP